MPLIAVPDVGARILGVLDGAGRPTTAGSTRVAAQAATAVSHPFDLSAPEVDELLARRRSTYTYGTQPIPADSVSRVLDLGRRAHAHDWPQAVHGESGLTTLVGAHSVDGLARGLYLPPSAGSGSFTVIDDHVDLQELRARYVAAPVLLFVCGDVRRATAPDHGIGYGSLLVRSGSLGYDYWLAALSTGMSAAVFGRSRAEVTDLARKVDPGLRHLFTVAIGHAAGLDAALRHPASEESAS